MKHAYLLYTGYGKTKLCLDFIIKQNPKPRVLLISTKKIVESAWSAEINKWYPNQISYAYITGGIKPEDRLKIIEQNVDILGMNTEILDWYIKNTTSVKRKTYTKQGIKLHYNEKELIERFDMIIIDESSLFKNYRTERFKLIKKWCHKVEHVFILSATPTPKNIEDLWAQIYLLDGGQRLGKNITEFRRNYGIAVPLSNGYNRYQYSKQAVDEVLDLVKDISTSIPAPPQPLFPEPVIKKTLIKPDEKTLELLTKFKEDYIIKLSNGKNLIAFNKTQLINKINQIASGDVYYQKNPVFVHDLKLNALKYLLQNITTPVLIVYVYRFDKEKLLTLPNSRLLSTPQDFEDWQNNKIKIGIISPYSTAHGLNLQDSDCQDIIWFSPIWDTEKWIQLNARVCRRGQTRKVTIRVLLLKGSFDEYAFDLCQTKFKMQYNNLLKLQ